MAVTNEHGVIPTDRVVVNTKKHLSALNRHNIFELPDHFQSLRKGESLHLSRKSEPIM